MCIVVPGDRIADDGRSVFELVLQDHFGQHHFITTALAWYLGSFAQTHPVADGAR